MESFDELDDVYLFHYDAGGSLIHYDGSEEEFKGAPKDCVWTLLEVDGVLCVEPGIAHVNKIAHLVSDHPYTKDSSQ